MTHHDQQAQQEERAMRLRDALDKFWRHECTEDDLDCIRWETCLTNYRPPTGEDNASVHPER